MSEAPSIQLHKEGQRCRVRMVKPGTTDELIYPYGEVLALVSADDREYRVNVRLDDGREIGACCPTCVIPITQ